MKYCIMISIFFLFISCYSENDQTHNNAAAPETWIGADQAPTVTDSDSGTGGVEVYGDMVATYDYQVSSELSSSLTGGISSESISLSFTNYNQDLNISEIRAYRNDNSRLNFSAFGELQDNNSETIVPINNNSEIILNFGKIETLHKIELDLSYKKREFVLFDLMVSDSTGTDENKHFFKFKNYYFALESTDSNIATFVLTNKKCLKDGEVLYPNGKCQIAQKRCPQGEINSCFITVGGYRRDCIVAQQRTDCINHYSESKVCKISEFYQFSQTEIVPLYYQGKLENKIFCRALSR